MPRYAEPRDALPVPLDEDADEPVAFCVCEPRDAPPLTPVGLLDELLLPEGLPTVAEPRDDVLPEPRLTEPGVRFTSRPPPRFTVADELVPREPPPLSPYTRPLLGER